MTKIIFESMDKDKKLLKKNKVVEYTPEQETALDMYVEMNRFMFPIMTVNENSNVDSIGYIKESGTLFVQYKSMVKSVEGFELGMRPEPFGYFYHDVHKLVYNNLVKAKNKAKFINDHIKKNYMYHREPVGLDLIDLR
jgi:hypothetical protein